MSSPSLDLAAVRVQFPALATGFVFADSAGGSQTTRAVADRVYDYLLNTNAQLGADYAVSVASTTRVAAGGAATAELFNATDPGEIAFASSSTMNVENLARALDADVKPGEEIIITDEHEANVGPWKRLADRHGLVLRVWHATAAPGDANPYAVAHRVEELAALVSARTRLVALSACSNILGTLTPIAAAVSAARAAAAAAGARKIEFCVDCVAYAPHRAIDVQAWDVEYAVFSFYKVYGPHISAMYVRAAALPALASLAHYFLPVNAIAYKLQPGGPGYELVHAAGAVLPYLRGLTPAGTLAAAWAAVAAHEQTLLAPLLGFLSAEEQFARGVRIVGAPAPGPDRVPTISFVVIGERALRSRDVVAAFDRTGSIGIRFGHFYAHSLIERLGLDPADGVIRISLVHYNTVEEVERIVVVLKEVLA